MMPKTKRKPKANKTTRRARRQRMGDVINPLTVRHGELTDEDRRDLTSRSFMIRQENIDSDTRTVRATISSENVVQVFDWETFRTIDEVLLNSGFSNAPYVPLLDNHRRSSNDDVFGSLYGFLDNGNGGIDCDIQFVDMSERPDTDEEAGRVERAWIRLKQRHQRNLSAGYRVVESVTIPPNKSRRVAGRNWTAGDRPLRIATKWVLREGSLTPIGADESATTRSELQRIEPVNKELKRFLETLGMRAQSTEAQAWAFYGSLTGQNRERADAMCGDAMPMYTGGRGEDETDPPGDTPPSDPEPPVTRTAPPAPPAPPTGETVTHVVNGLSVQARADASPAEIAGLVMRANHDRQVALRQLFTVDGQVAAEDQELLQTYLDNPEMTAERAAPELLRRTRQRRTAPVAPDGAIPTGVAGHTRSSIGEIISNDTLAGALIMSSSDNAQMSELTHDSLRSPIAAHFGGTGVPEIMRREINNDERQQFLENSRRLSSLSMPDICRYALMLNGHEVPFGQEEMVERAFSTNSLNPIFTTSVNARMLGSFVEAADSTEGWCSTEDVSNFKKNERPTMGKVPKLTKHARGGKADQADIDATQEEFRIARYSQQWSIDEMDVIDDHFGAANTVTPEDMGRAARQLRPDLVYAILLGNPSLLSTGNPVFDAGQGNLSAGALSIANLEQAEVWFGNQRIKDRPLNLMARYIIVPRELRWLAARMLGSNEIRDNDAAAGRYALSNPISGEDITLVFDARMGVGGVVDPNTEIAYAGSATQWLVSARPGENGAKTVNVAYRRGTGRTPTTRSKLLDQGCWGHHYDIKHDIGAAALGYRAMKKFTG